MAAAAVAPAWPWALGVQSQGLKGQGHMHGCPHCHLALVHLQQVCNIISVRRHLWQGRCDVRPYHGQQKGRLWLTARPMHNSRSGGFELGGMAGGGSGIRPSHEAGRKGMERLSGVHDMQHHMGPHLPGTWDCAGRRLCPGQGPQCPARRRLLAPVHAEGVQGQSCAGGALVSGRPSAEISSCMSKPLPNLPSAQSSGGRCSRHTHLLPVE